MWLCLRLCGSFYVVGVVYASAWSMGHGISSRGGEAVGGEREVSRERDGGGRGGLQASQWGQWGGRDKVENGEGWIHTRHYER